MGDSNEAYRHGSLWLSCRSEPSSKQHGHYYWRASLVPAVAVIPAPAAYTYVVAPKTPAAECVLSRQLVPAGRTRPVRGVSFDAPRTGPCANALVARAHGFPWMLITHSVIFCLRDKFWLLSVQRSMSCVCWWCRPVTLWLVACHVACVALFSISMKRFSSHGKWCTFACHHARLVNGTT